MVILTMVAAFAQTAPEPTPKMPGYSSMRTEKERQSDKAIDHAYQSTIKGRPDPVKNSDPWGDVRATQPTPADKNKQR
jgi:hypothetical protein